MLSMPMCPFQAPSFFPKFIPGWNCDSSHLQTSDK